MDVVAEETESMEQGEFLRAHGCDRSQGYFYSRPLSAAQIEPLLVGQDWQAHRDATEAIA